LILLSKMNQFLSEEIRVIEAGSDYVFWKFLDDLNNRLSLIETGMQENRIQLNRIEELLNKILEENVRRRRVLIPCYGPLNQNL